MDKERKQKLTESLLEMQKADALKDSILIGKISLAIQTMTEVMEVLAARHRWEMFEPNEDD